MKSLSSSILLFCLLVLVSCGGKSGSTTADHDGTDSVETDSSAISDEFFSEDNNDEDYTYEDEEDIDPPSYNSHSSGGTHYGSGEDYDISKYENYERTGSEPKDFAQALVLPIIRMVYEENFKSAKAKVLNSELNEGRYTIDILVKWSDRWVENPYEVEGILEVNEDGTKAEYTVVRKNEEAEALEFTNENFKNDLTIDQI
ncbi:MAG: hypothetical protein GY810_27000 [Aureispira sp.]|nr:hypothetical protein [Aureispira sp.]